MSTQFRLRLLSLCLLTGTIAAWCLEGSAFAQSIYPPTPTAVPSLNTTLYLTGNPPPAPSVPPIMSVGLVAPMSSPSPTPQTVPTPSSLRDQKLIELIALLSADDYQSRIFAQGALYLLGPVALPMLHEIAMTPGLDIETRRRAELVAAWISGTGYSGAFRAIPISAKAEIDVNLEPPSGVLELSLLLETGVPGLSFQLQEDLSAGSVSEIFECEGEIISEWHRATFKNRGTDNIVKAFISDFRSHFTDEEAPRVSHRIHLSIPVSIRFLGFNTGVNTILDFDIRDVPVDFRYFGGIELVPVD